MPTPLYALRLPQKTQDDIAELAKVYGAPTGRAFAREILEVMTSGDMEKVKAFNARLVQKVGEQLTLKFNAMVDAASEPQKQAKKGQKGKKGGWHAGKRQ